MTPLTNLRYPAELAKATQLDLTNCEIRTAYIKQSKAILLNLLMNCGLFDFKKYKVIVKPLTNNVKVLESKRSDLLIKNKLISLEKTTNYIYKLGLFFFGTFILNAFLYKEQRKYSKIMLYGIRGNFFLLLLMVGIFQKFKSDISGLNKKQLNFINMSQKSVKMEEKELFKHAKTILNRNCKYGSTIPVITNAIIKKDIQTLEVFALEANTIQKSE